MPIKMYDKILPYPQWERKHFPNNLAFRPELAPLNILITGHEGLFLHEQDQHCEQKSRRYPDFRLNLRTFGLELRWYIHPNQTLGVWFILVLIYELLALRGWVFAKIKLHQLWDTKSWYLATNISISYTSSSLFWHYNKIFQLRLVNWVIKFMFLWCCAGESKKG